MIVLSSIVVTVLVILAFILYSKKKKILADRYLMAFFLSIALGMLNDLLWNLFPHYYFILRFGSTTVPLAAAFLYLYSASLISSKPQTTKVKILLFIPSAIVLITNIFISEKEVVTQANIWLVSFYYTVKIGLSALITVMIGVKINRYSKRIKDCFSDIEKIEFRWLKFIVNTSLLLFISIPLGILLLYLGQIGSLRAFGVLANILIFVFVFTLAYYGIKNTNTFKDVVDDIADDDKANSQESEPKVIMLNPVVNDVQVSELEAYMVSNKPYLSERLTIAQLANRVNIPQRQLSNIINSKYGMNFFDFINSYRIKEFNMRIERGDSNNFTILAIAFDCGFSSKSAFNRAYKKHVGVPPSEFAQSGTYS